MTWQRGIKVVDGIKDLLRESLRIMVLIETFSKLDELSNSTTVHSNTDLVT